MIPILYVDDDRSLLEITKQFLQTMGILVDTAESGEKALRKIQTSQYQAVISDYEMPGMNGIALLKEVRKRYPELPFILFTGKGREEVVIEAYECGADYYLQKGGETVSQFTELYHKITAAVRHRTAVRQNRINEERLRRSHAAGKTGCWEYNLKTNLIWGSDEMLRIFGYHQPAGEMSIGTIEECIPDTRTIRKALDDLIRDNKDSYLEFPIHPADGGDQKILFSHATLALNQDGFPEKVVGIIQDITDRKRAEEKVAEFESRFRIFFDNEPNYCYMVSSDGKILDLNNSALKILGYSSKDEIVGKPLIPTIYSPESQDKARLAFEEWRKTGKISHREMVIRSRTGEERIVSLHASAVFSSDGSMAHSISIQTDITEQKQNELFLQESEERYRHLVSLSPVGIVVHTDNRIVFANKALVQIIGASSPGDLIGHDVRAFVHPDFYEPVNERLNQVIENRSTGIPSMREKFVRVDGTIIDVDVSGTSLTYQGNQSVLAIIRDVSENVRIEEKIRESEKRYRDLLSVLNDGVLFSTPDLVTSFVNPRMAEMLEYSVEEMVGRSVLDFVDPGYRSEVTKKFEGRKHGISDRYEVLFRKKSGDTFLSIVNTSPMFSDSGHFQGSVVSIIDITQQRHSEDILTLSNQIFHLSNRYQELHPMLMSIVHLIQEYTSCECVGIRILDPAGNIPYPAYVGFSDEFYLMESPLNINRDECMCIYVIRGDANPDLSVITENGSFYCNATTKFLSSVSDEDKGKTRNICNETGFESVALIAIKRGPEILGLVHLADHREGMVPLQTVKVLENVSQALGSVIQRGIAEKKTRESLAEKEILLREIHHRVKNNLASIISLIELEAQSIQDPEVTSRLGNITTRIKSMALVHESLYQGDNLNGIDLMQYITSLADYLIHSYSGNIKPVVHVHTHNIALPVDIATPCGLILTEIISNALKHGFPSGRPGNQNENDPCTIGITIEQEGGKITIIAGDNGVGMKDAPAEPDIQKLGLFLIDFIVRHQLRGEIFRDTSSGTMYTIRFPWMPKVTESMIEGV